MIFKLGESGAIALWISRQVLREIEGVVRRKVPDAIGFLALLLDRSAFQIGRVSNADLLKQSRTLTGHPGDAQVLAEAWTAGADYFVTLDEQHFLRNSALRKGVPFVLGTPGDFLSWYRQRFVPPRIEPPSHLF